VQPYGKNFNQQFNFYPLASKQLTIAGIIPSRYASQRLPGKPLVTINGKSMVQRVYEQAAKSALLSEVIVATDDQRVYDHVQAFGGQVAMTSTKHTNGTERCGEVLAEQGAHWDAVINIQGDEPFIDPQQIDLVCRAFDDGFAGIATLCKKIHDPAQLDNSAVMKLIMNRQNEAMYFSRSPIPHCRGYDMKDWLNHHTYYKHIGIYGYHTSVLREIINLSPTPLEITESLEQLRWLENGYRIRVTETDKESESVDTPEDLERLEQTSKK